MEYFPVMLEYEIDISRIVSVHYFEYTKDFAFAGESHDFWEFVYVDKGELIAVAGEQEILLRSGMVLFRKPNLWHTDRANGKKAPNVVIVSFFCHSEAMLFLQDALLSVGNYEKSLLSKLIAEAKNVFSNPLGNPYTKRMEKRKEIPFGAQQLVLLYLKELIIRFIRQRQFSFLDTPKDFRVNSGQFSEEFEEVLSYLKRHVTEKVCLLDLARHVSSSLSSVKALFQKNVGMGFKPYFIAMKMEYAKTYLREANYNITQISQQLGYENIHYFSRLFKQYVGMSPSEYQKSVRQLIDEQQAGKN